MNTKLSALVVILLFSATTFAQKMKIKQKSISYNYTVYPELDGFEGLKYYTMKITDQNGTRYTYSEGNTDAAKKADIYNPLGMAYGFKWLTQNNDFNFEITVMASEENPRELSVYQDPGTKKKKYSYRLTAKQTYNVKILSADNELIKEFTLSDVETMAYWPGAPSATVGYNSEKLLADNYVRKEETQEGFIKARKSDLIQNVLKSKIGKEIVMVLHESKKKFLYDVTTIKTKSDKFLALDSALIYLNEGFELVKANTKSGVKGNHHAENALALFNKADAIYEKFSGDEYVDLFTDKEQQESYIFVMAANLYLTSFLTSDFETANKFFEAVASKSEADQSVPAEMTIAGQLGSVKSSAATKAMARMENLRYHQLREERLQEVFQKRIGY